jgi:PfaD family protein
MKTSLPIKTESPSLLRTVRRIREPLYLFKKAEQGGLLPVLASEYVAEEFGPVFGHLPPVYPEWLGNRRFAEAHGVRFNYVVGEMARGIATAEMVIQAGKAGMLGFYGAGGVPLPNVEAAIDKIQADLDPLGASYGVNLIHSPNKPEVEHAMVELLLAKKVHRISASAFMSLQPTVVRYAFHGLKRLPDGSIYRPNFVFAKISRPEVALPFLSPPPAELLRSLVADGKLTAEEASLAANLPVAEDITVESDSGGHTDNRPLAALFPLIYQLSLEVASQYGFAQPARVGAAGGLGTPAALAAAFSLGAAFVLTGTINQAAVESGLSALARKTLTEAGVADCTMAPAGDMFELGVKVQVLRKGTLFPQRATRLYDLYQNYPGIDALPADVRAKLEKEIFKAPLETIWAKVVERLQGRRTDDLARAQRDPKHRMALIFRWYLGSSSHWPISGDADRRLDYQIWCGPAIGSFNTWVKGSFLESPENRTVVQIGRNLMEGAAVIARAGQLRSMGVELPEAAFHFAPRYLS